MYTPKKVVVIIKKGPAFCTENQHRAMVNWKEVQKYGALSLAEICSVIAKIELWRGDYCLLTDQERAIARAYNRNIGCSNCAAKEQCDAYIC